MIHITRINSRHVLFAVAINGSVHMKRLLAALLFALCAASGSLAAPSLADRSPYSIDSQPQPVRQILEREKNIESAKKIHEIVEYIDTVYGSLHERIKNGGKIVVFVDPAHGKLENGTWSGAATDRLSTTGKPEEHYSIMLSRKLYRLLTANRHIEVKSTDDFMRVMRGESDTYNNISFNDTVRLARECRAFIIVSEHLNNVSVFKKAGGLSNMPGVHLTFTRGGSKYLIHIRNTYKGFLTLYNKFDVTGASKKYSDALRANLIAKGLAPNNWDFGSVADDRFTYFVDFPVSVIYESGFISNPEEEKLLSDASHQDRIVSGQYDTLLSTIRDLFGVDISGNSPAFTTMRAPITMMKLSRIAIHYLKNGNPQNAIYAIGLMQKSYGSSEFRNYLAPYVKVKNNIARASQLQSQALKLAKGPAKNRKIAIRRQAKARQLYRSAMRHIGKRSLYAPLREHYAMEFKTAIGARTAVSVAAPPTSTAAPAEKMVSFSSVKRAGLHTPIILTIENGDSLERSIEKALGPDRATLQKLVTSFSNAGEYRRVKVASYSKKKKKMVWSWKRVRQPVSFEHGIYIVRLNRTLGVVSVSKTGRVPLVAGRYQNHQYLKNSYFAPGEKTRSL